MVDDQRVFEERPVFLETIRTAPMTSDQILIGDTVKSVIVQVGETITTLLTKLVTSDYKKYGNLFSFQPWKLIPKVYNKILNMTGVFMRVTKTVG